VQLEAEFTRQGEKLPAVSRGGVSFVGHVEEAWSPRFLKVPFKRFGKIGELRGCRYWPESLRCEAWTSR
jgi:hypothetical protein